MEVGQLWPAIPTGASIQMHARNCSCVRAWQVEKREASALSDWQRVRQVATDVIRRVEALERERLRRLRLLSWEAGEVSRVLDRCGAGRHLHAEHASGRLHAEHAPGHLQV